MTSIRIVVVASVVSLLLSVPAVSQAPSTRGGTIVGVVTTTAPAAPPIRVTIDSDVCGQTVPDESVSVDAEGRVSGAIVSVAGVRVAAPPQAVVLNTGCRFVPHVSWVRSKGALKMSSSDRVMHTMHAAGADGRALFNISLPLPDVTMSRPLDKPGVVTLSCSTHTWMRGYVLVSDEQSAVTGPDGSFRLEQVPAGVHELHVWHELLHPGPIKVTVKDGATVTVPLTLDK